MRVVTAVERMSELGRAWRRVGLRVGLVPTMGFLHRGHLSLIERLMPHADRLVVSIYVNPLQFGPQEDLDRYPRDLEGDLAKCRERGVDAVFAPGDFYPQGFRTALSVHDLSERLCGIDRPGHFEGVATVVARLFALTGCHAAIFGEKDYQQLQIIRRLVADLGLGVDVHGAPLVRDDDGVALSSRNANLSPEDRIRARTLYAALTQIAEGARGGERSVAPLLDRARRIVQADVLEYLEVVDPGTLHPLRELTGPARAVVAARFGGTRLIDNLEVG